ncbi:hypothetical protein MED01_002323 [Micromonospora sp. MED01]|uniref:hypothetical protein n=1 Tax=Micromonospora alfalfae TaxID=2911212 RepID=UPI001EE788DC|nr:hypothetical protein [Micromonospora alfalfae]MCG5464158.1 hypothetical protein [Micromonospora alfalfae]
MSVELHAATPIEVYTITAADYAVAVGVGMLVALLAVTVTAWVFWPEKPDTTPTPVEVDAPEALKTWEIPRRSGPRVVATIHAPQYHRSNDDTQVIEPAETRP